MRRSARHLQRCPGVTLDAKRRARIMTEGPAGASSTLHLAAMSATAASSSSTAPGDAVVRAGAATSCSKRARPITSRRRGASNTRRLSSISASPSKTALSPPRFAGALPGSRAAARPRPGRTRNAGGAAHGPTVDIIRLRRPSKLTSSGLTVPHPRLVRAGLRAAAAGPKLRRTASLPAKRCARALAEVDTAGIKRLPPQS